MKQTELIQLISTPYKSIYGDMEKLQELKKQFPFFQSAHMLLTLVSKKYDSGVYQDTLRKTAITIPNRARLYSLLNSAEVVEEVVAQKQTSEIEHLKAIELHSDKQRPTEEVLTQQVEKEMEKQLITAFVEKEVLKTHDWYKPKEKKELKKREEKNEKKEEINSGSFSDWLQALKKADRVEVGTETKTEEVEEEESRIITDFKKPDDKKAAEKAIIDKIIEAEPGNIRLDPNQKFFEANQKAKESLLENEHLVTETLAKIYALQGNVPKAIRAYEILSLKFPQKSAYFASLIENLKKDNK
ncbi:MAG: hypothetical protein KA163_05715 [Bacteroidia bacterium]|nr:hypothetical protein [Bacteroidia bacterium]